MQRLSENVRLLGNGYFNYYVVGQTEAVVIECGMSAGVAIFSRQWAKMGDKPRVKSILALHSHFDHVCGIPMLKALFPDTRVLASAAAQKVLTLDKVLTALSKADEVVSEAYFRAGLVAEKPGQLKISLMNVDQAVGEGDLIIVGDDLHLSILEAPGHSPCSIAAYLETEQVMFVSDAAGYRAPEGLMSPVFFQDYDLYMDTIRKLMTYPTEILAVGHGEVVVSQDKVQQFYQQSLAAAEGAFNNIKEKLASGEQEGNIAAELFQTYIKGGLAFYPRNMMLGSMYQLIKNVKARM